LFGIRHDSSRDVTRLSTTAGSAIPLVYRASLYRAVYRRDRALVDIVRFPSGRTRRSYDGHRLSLATGRKPKATDYLSPRQSQHRSIRISWLYRLEPPVTCRSSSRIIPSHPAIVNSLCSCIPSLRPGQPQLRDTSVSSCVETIRRRADGSAAAELRLLRIECSGDSRNIRPLSHAAGWAWDIRTPGSAVRRGMMRKVAVEMVVTTTMATHSYARPTSCVPAPVRPAK
jgi:hypothetical protein